MKKIIIYIIMAAVLSSLASASFCDTYTTVFCEDFEDDDVSDWQENDDGTGGAFVSNSTGDLNESYFGTYQGDNEISEDRMAGFFHPFGNASTSLLSWDFTIRPYWQSPTGAIHKILYIAQDHDDDTNPTAEDGAVIFYLRSGNIANPGEVEFSIYDGSYHDCGLKYTSGHKYHVQITTNYSDVNVTINGTLQSSCSGAYVIDNALTRFNYVALSGGANNYFHYDIDNMMICNGTSCGTVGAAGVSNPSFQPPTPADNAYNNTNQTINVSHGGGTGIRYYFYVNDDAYYLNVSQSGTDYFNWTTNFTDGAYIYKVSVQNITDGTFSENISRTLNIDTVMPTITITANNSFATDNLTIISNNVTKGLSLNISFADEADLYQTLINITNETGDSMYSRENTSITGTTDNVTEIVDISGWAIGNYTVILEATDSHTKKSINDYWTLKGLNYIRYDTEEGNIIYIESSTIPLKMSTKKKADRYTFLFNFLLSSEKQKFTIKANNPIDYLADSIYPAHFVIVAQGGEGNWVDFSDMGLSNDDYEVKKINDYEYDIIITTHGKKSFSFDSIGGLNRAVEHYFFRVGAVIDIWSYDEEADTPINATATSGSQSAHTITGTQPAKLYNITKETVSVTLNSSGYGTAAKTISITDNYHNFTLNLTPSQAVKMYFYDESSEGLIANEQMEVYLESSSLGFSDTYTINTTSDNPYILSGLDSGLYDLEASSTNYPERSYFDLNVTDVSTTNIDIYMINSTDGDEITFEVTDSDGDELEDVLSYIKKIINGTSTVMAQEETDFAGRFKLYMDDTYEYDINFSKNSYVDKEITLEPDALDSPYTIILESSGRVVPPIYDSILLSDIEYNLTYNTSDSQILFEWHDEDNTASNLCLDVFTMKEVYSSQCADTIYGSHSYSLTNRNISYVARAIATRNSRNYTLDTEDIPASVDVAWEELGEDSLLISLAVFLAISFLGLFSPIAAVFLGVFALAGLYFMNLLPITFGTIVGIAFVAVVITIVGLRKRR